MILDRIKDFSNNLIEKASNPFGGTLILSWMIHNWRLVYSMIYFDPGTNLNQRIELISSYLHKSDKSIDYANLLLQPIWTALVAVIAYQLLGSITQSIVSLFTNYVKPYLLSLVKDYHLVTKERHDSLNESFLGLRSEHEKARTNLALAYKEIKEQQETNIEIGTKYDELERERRSVMERHTAELTKKEEIILSNADLITKVTNELEELKKSLEVNTSENLEVIFKGRWKNDYIMKDGSKGSEIFVIKDKNKYMVDGRTIFLLENIKVDNRNKIVSFEKIDINDSSRRAKNNLIIESRDRLVGYEPDETLVVYTSLDATGRKAIFEALTVK